METNARTGAQGLSRCPDNQRLEADSSPYLELVLGKAVLEKDPPRARRVLDRESQPQDQMAILKPTDGWSINNSSSRKYQAQVVIVEHQRRVILDLELLQHMSELELRHRAGRVGILRI